jgi:uncharacterized CHY-type Zn-finger protein
MNKEIMKAAGLGDMVEEVSKGNCPFCKKPIVMSMFRDALSVKEFNISGICQTCQDDFFDDKEG